MLAALRALDKALAEPKLTRPGLRRQMLAALAAIAERGPAASQALLPCNRSHYVSSIVIEAVGPQSTGLGSSGCC